MNSGIINGGQKGGDSLLKFIGLIFLNMAVFFVVNNQNNQYAKWSSENLENIADTFGKIYEDALVNGPETAAAIEHSINAVVNDPDQLDSSSMLSADNSETGNELVNVNKDIVKIKKGELALLKKALSNLDTYIHLEKNGHFNNIVDAINNDFNNKLIETAKELKGMTALKNTLTTRDEYLILGWFGDIFYGGGSRTEYVVNQVLTDIERLRTTMGTLTNELDVIVNRMRTIQNNVRAIIGQSASVNKFMWLRFLVMGWLLKDIARGLLRVRNGLTFFPSDYEEEDGPTFHIMDARGKKKKTSKKRKAQKKAQKKASKKKKAQKKRKAQKNKNAPKKEKHQKKHQKKG